MDSFKEDELQHLKTHLAITPKTVHLLYDSGYRTPQSLGNSTPNEIAARFARLPGMNAQKAKVYIGALRRMTMLGDIEDADEAAAIAKHCQKWSIKELTRLGVWEDGFDDSTGAQIRRKMQAARALP